MRRRDEHRGRRRLERRILEELVFERVKLTVDLCELMAFEGDLAESVARALAHCAASPAERAEISLRYVERAWRRLGAEVLARAAVCEGAGELAPRRELDGRPASGVDLRGP